MAVVSKSKKLVYNALGRVEATTMVNQIKSVPSGLVDDFSIFNRLFMSMADIELPRNITPSVRSFMLGRCRLTQLNSPASKVSIAKPNRFDADTLRLLLQVRGQTRVVHPFCSDVVVPGSLILYDPAHLFNAVSPDNTEHILLHIPRELFVNRAADDIRAPLLLTPNESGLTAIYASYAQSLVEQSERLASSVRQKLEIGLLDLVVELLREKRAHSVRQIDGLETLLQRIIDHVEREIDKPLDVSTIAAKMHCSPRYVHEAFSRKGTTPAQFVWTTRLEKARQEIRENGQAVTLTEVAIKFGFKSYSHFSRSFKQRYGVPPAKLAAASHQK